MGMANNDFNWRLVAAAALTENQAVTINSSGKAAVSDGTNAIGFVPQAINSGERAPIMRGGKLSGLSGFSAGQRLRGQVSGGLGTGGSNPILAVVVSEDATCAVILSGNLDEGL